MSRAHYTISLPHPERHLVDVELRLSGVAGLGEAIDLRMAAWSPGSYLIRDYARYVRHVEALCDGAPCAIEKVDKATWRARAGGADEVVVRYQVYGHDLTVRTNHIDDTHAFLHGPATYLYAPALPAEQMTVSVTPPEDWDVHTGLRAEGEGYAAADLDELLDCPIHVGLVEERAVEAAGRPTRIAVWGQPVGTAATLDDLAGDVGRIVDRHAARFGGAPYRDYTFIVMLAPDAYGGLEHRNSSANLNAPFAFSTRKDYESLLELLSHEFFHVWNGKRIRPAVLGPFDYAREAYTRSLWVQEGITSYVDRHTVCASGCQSARDYLEKLADEWGRLQAIPGRKVHSLEESSFDAWIKLYKPDECNVNTTVSYYLKGSLVSLVADLEIRARSGGESSIDDVLRLLWERYGAAERGYDDTDVQRLFEDATDLEVGAFFDCYIRGTEDPDLPGALDRVGLFLAPGHDPKPAEGRTPVWLGVAIDPGLRVTAVLDGSPAAVAGVSPGDELVAIDSWRVRADADVRRRLADHAAADTASLSLFRRGRLRELSVELAQAPPNRYEIASVEAPSDAQRQRFEAWLGEPHPGPMFRVGATVTGWL